MDGADTRASEHRCRRFGDHRHVDHHAVAAFDAAGLEQVGEAAGLFVELLVSPDVALARLVGLEDQRGAVPVLGEVAVEAVDRQVELTVGVPGNVEIVFVERPVAGLRRKFVPGEPPRLVEPETVGVGIDTIVELRDLARADPRAECLRNRMHRLGHQTSLAARSRTRRACTRCGRSTILPPTDSTPALGCASNAATISSA